MKYYVITPAKNEEKYITFTLDSMVNQLLKPAKWIIVDDGSTDDTKQIVQKYQKEHNWIELVTIDNKQEQKLYGSKVIKAFNAGLKLIKEEQYDFIVKLDADLSFPPEYFKDIATAFTENPKLGICGGFIVEKESDFITKSSRYPRVQGATKAVRAKCFKDIGGFMEANGWDGIDLLNALYLKWEIGNVPIRVIHHRIEGTEYRSMKFFRNNGYTHYMQGNDLFLTFVRGIFMLREKPFFIVSLNYLKGYFEGMFSKQPKYVDKDFAKFIRKYHYKRLLNFKR